MNYKIIISLLVLILLSGCATQIPLSPEDSRKIHNIMIDPNIDMPNAMYFYGDGVQFFSSFGLVGAIIQANIIDKDTRIIRNVAFKNNISFERLIISEVAKHLRNSTPYRVSSKRGDAVLKLKILHYGFQATGFGFSNRLAPTVALEAQLVGKNRVIWQDTIGVCGLAGNIKSYTINEIASDGRCLNYMWQAISDVLGRELTLKMLAK